MHNTSVFIGYFGLLWTGKSNMAKDVRVISMTGGA
jgi:hypothetical protein